jgi:phosphoenolpyruvate synthase/pyruvate phosphate dikinase
VSNLIAEFADEQGGYFVTRSESSVTLRLPNERLDEFRELISQLADETIRFDPSSFDLRLQLIRVDAGITSRTEALDQILIYLEDADIEATLAFELELRAINGELETLIGQKRKLEHDIEYSFVSVVLSSTESEIPVHRPSSFGWINRVDLYYFISEAGW